MRRLHGKRWLEETRPLVRGDASIRGYACKGGLVPLAIMMALLRPDPERFATWTEALPNTRTPVLVTAATLCGLGRGYSGVPAAMRSRGDLEAKLAVRALRAAVSGQLTVEWPGVDTTDQA